MASIYDPEIKITSVKKTSSPEEDKKNDGFSKYTVTAEVTFDVYDMTEENAKNDALRKLDHALS